MGSELKPCPFCGGRAEYKQGIHTGYVMCLRCEVMGPNVAEAEAIAAWNRRSEPRGDDRGSGLRPLALAEPNSGATADTSSAAGVWVTVPREPTEAMIDEGVNALWPDGSETTDLAAAYRAMIASAPKAEVEGWRDIESAPKDQTFIDVSDAYGTRTTDVKWDAKSSHWVQWIGAWGQDWCEVSPPPTHWRPLPAPPAKRDGADEPHLVEASTEREARSHTDPTPDPLVIVKPRRKG